MAKKGEKVQFELAVGDEASDMVTGFTGVVTAQFHYLNGCKRYLLEAGGDKPTSKPEELVFDEDRLEPTKKPNAKIPATGGGPPSSSAPARQRHG